MLSNNMKISYVELPKTVSLILKKNFNVHTEKFFPKTQEIITSNNITSNNIISNNIGSISITGHFSLSENLLIKEFLLEFKSFIPNTNLSNYFGQQINNFTVAYDENNKMFAFGYYTVFVIDDIVVIIPKKSDEYFIINKKQGYIYFDNINGIFTMNNNYLKGLIKKENKKHQNILIRDLGSWIMKKYFFNNYKTNLKMYYSSYELYGICLFENYLKNNLFVEKTHMKSFDNNDYLKIVSKCMVNDDKEPFCGTFTLEQKGDEIEKKLSKGNTVVYHRFGKDVKLDALSKKEKTNDFTIGWKVAKSLNGDNRIVKLMIPNDAKIVKPIDEEYFYAKAKERCNKAIVMDIQLPDREIEISVVPEEKSAYSYVFDDTMFEYKIGKLVEPDKFDENDNISCTHGIHFYSDRITVFNQYIDTKKDK